MSGRQRSPVVALVVAVVTAVVIGAVLMRAGDPGSTEDDAAATGARGVDPDLERNDASDRSATPGARTETDPVDAAIAHVTASQEWLYLSDVELDAAIRSVTTPARSSPWRCTLRSPNRSCEPMPHAANPQPSMPCTRPTPKASAQHWSLSLRSRLTASELS